MTELQLILYYYDKKRDFYKDIIIENDSDFTRFDPIIVMNQLRYVAEGSWKGGFNLMKYIDTKLKYVSENELMLQVDANTWYPKMRKIKTKSHFVYFEKYKDWKQIKNNSNRAGKMYLKHIAEMI